jgi:hypothetical protein
MPKHTFKGKNAAEVFALGGTGPEAKAAFIRGGGKKEDFKSQSRGFRETARESAIGKQTAGFQAATGGSSGYTDVYRSGQAGEITGPEFHLGKSRDVDIHGYPEDWAIRSTDEGQYITPTTGSWAGKEYFKPTDSGGGGGDTTTGGGGVVISGMQPFDLATLTDEMDLINVISNLVNRDSPLMKAAGTAAMQRMAKRGSGLLNSSIALRTVEDAVIRLATDIGSKHVDNLIANLEKNTQWTNDQRKQANDYVYGLMVKEIDNAATLKLQGLKETSALAQQRYSGLADIMAAEKTQPSYWDEYMKRVGMIAPT